MSELKDICHEAIKYYGVKNQIRKAREELTELLLELNRPQIDDLSVVDEIADVVIMMLQLSIIFGESKVDERIEFKLKRLKERMERGSYASGDQRIDEIK